MENEDKLKFFVDRVRSFASAHDLLVRSGRYIVALSGGADSVSLLLAMKALAHENGMTVDAAHCNFHLRGDESVRDEMFCVELCQRLGVELHRIHFDTHEYAELHHVSIEMAARDLRYAYFERLRKDIGATDICVAHHRDDSVETVLLNLVRGTGLRGLRGIQPRNGNVIRPLLCLGREDILDFLDSAGETYVTDSSNLHNDVKRNKIRLDVIPMLRQLNPSVTDSIFETSLRVGEALKVYDDAVEKSIKRLVVPMTETTDTDLASVPIMIDIEQLLCLPSPESILFHVLNVRGFGPLLVKQIYGMLGNDHGNMCRVGKIVQSATHELLFDRGHLVAQPLQYGVCTRIMRMPEPGTYVYAENIKISIVEEMVTTDYQPSRDNWCICVDANVVEFPLTLRPTHEGEWFIPFGMKGKKLVSDFLTSLKLTLFDKRRQLVLEDASGSIVWLVGRRVDNRFRICEKTTRTLRITLRKE